MEFRVTKLDCDTTGKNTRDLSHSEENSSSLLSLPPVRGKGVHFFPADARIIQGTRKSYLIPEFPMIGNVLKL